MAWLVVSHAEQPHPCLHHSQRAAQVVVAPETEDDAGQSHGGGVEASLSTSCRPCLFAPKPTLSWTPPSVLGRLDGTPSSSSLSRLFPLKQTGSTPLLIFLETKDSDLVSTRNWKAVSAALDRNQPTTILGQGLLNRGRNPLTDRSSGV